MPSRAYSLTDASALLTRTPGVLRALLDGLPPTWTRASEGEGTWTPYDVVGHLIHGERTDWIPRVRHILQFGDTQPFAPFDRDAMFRDSVGFTLEALLDAFAARRRQSLDDLATLALTDADLDRCGRHPVFGVVTLRQHLATWVAHDLTHIHQIARTLAHQYKEEVGPWRADLSILR